MNATNFSRAINRISFKLKTRVSDINSVSIIRVDARSEQNVGDFC